MTYWTMGEDELLPAVTLCEEHALEATNFGAEIAFGLGPFSTMQEAAAVLNAAVSLFGQGNVTPFDFTTAEEGWCEECEIRAEAESA